MAPRIRAWGQRNGWDVKPGRLPQALIDAYREAIEADDDRDDVRDR
jgi:hypothetical protein